MELARSTVVSIVSKMSVAYIALGSNLGDRGGALHQALRLLTSLGNLQSTSFMYKSEPMYHSDQPSFMNAACKIETDLPPQQLLAGLKTIEHAMGRQETFRNGPRIIDLDILMYGTSLVTDSNLVIPHPRMAERSFVLRPLCDIDGGLMHPTLHQPIHSLYDSLAMDNKQSLKRVIPCYNHLRRSTRYLNLDGGLPFLMGIVNVTPDSFSDGGEYSFSVDASVAHAKKLVRDGANILDIGGESTRPGAVPVPVEDEIRRVIPVIQALRSEGVNTLISVDTRKSGVAAAAIQAGADIINDVSGGIYDPAMIPLVGRLRVPYIVMHMRGEPSTMTDSKYTSYKDTVHEVTQELRGRLSAMDSVIPRWLQIVDPGIGFAKGYKENMEVLRPDNLLAFKEALGSRPLLVGLSRKRFLTSIASSRSALRDTLVSPYDSEEGSSASEHSSVADSLSVEERDLLSAGANCAALLGSADILRVHDVATSRRVIDAFTSIIGK